MPPVIVAAARANAVMFDEPLDGARFFAAA